MFKKITAVLLITAILATCISCKKDDELSLKSSEVKLELGSTLSNNVSQYISGPDDMIKKATMDTSTLDFNKVGSYTVIIKSGDQTLNLKVTVQDTTAPVVELTSNTIKGTVGTPITVAQCIKSVNEATEYKSGFKSETNELQDSVKYDAAGTYNVEVSVVDAAGNTTTLPVTINIEEKAQEPAPEPTKPAEPLNSDLNSYSNENVPFGVGTAVDKDNRPTGLSWYTTKFGNFAADFIKPLSNEVYLTFDEGYENGYTPKILDTLKEKNVKAVFFCTLPFIKENPDLVQRMIDEGHVVGNHSVTHPSKGLASLSTDQQISEVKTVNDYVLEHFNYQMYLWRFPTGAFSQRSLAVVQSLGYRSVFWSFAYDDYHTDAQPDINVALNNALSKVHGGAIYLLHAVSATNTAMLGDFIDGVRAKGLDFGYYSK